MGENSTPVEALGHAEGNQNLDQIKNETTLIQNSLGSVPNKNASDDVVGGVFVSLGKYKHRDEEVAARF